MKLEIWHCKPYLQAMDEELEVFEGFDSIETARFVLLHLLEENNIPYAIFKDTYRQEIILGSSMDMVSLWVKIRRSDFTKVNLLMLSAAKERSTDIPADHYLREMSAEELLQILKNRDEWGVEDIVIAQKLLAQQGIEISDTQIEDWYANKLAALELAKRNELNNLSNLNAASLLNRATHIQDATVLNKQTGERKHVFTAEERKRNRITYVVGIIIFLAVMLLIMIRTNRHTLLF